MEKEFGAVFALLGRVSNQLSMNKAFSQVILRELAKVNQLNYPDLIADVEKLHAQYTFDENKVTENLMNQTLNPNAPDSWIKDQFGL
ncbi:hypothetical protein CLV58_1175 [Spirosoma oryzae]|uniref:Uncharacterized protein n=1 Tax=Spirosoma oryzae TaxID=1469603 RepID=A0A2T0SLV4_9BACT|nr:hypothetical protein [Spirosoma oryzae]PRY34401.1 hypothetical protein CLV58_1175 [Spirosoma oryzae]